MTPWNLVGCYKSLGKTAGFIFKTKQHKTLFNNRGADKSLARRGRKQATATEDIDFYISHL